MDLILIFLKMRICEKISRNGVRFGENNRLGASETAAHKKPPIPFSQDNP